MSNEDELARLATATLSSMVDEYGSVKTTVGQLLAQFGHSELTGDAIDDVWMALRDAGLRETPILSESKLALESKIKIRRAKATERLSTPPQNESNTIHSMPGNRSAGTTASCAECGAALADRAKFCHACGSAVVGTVAASSTAPVLPKEAEPPPPIQASAPQPSPLSTHSKGGAGTAADNPGSANSKRKRWPWVVAGCLVLLVIVGAIAGNNKKSPSTATHAAVSTPAPPPEPAVSLHLNAGSYTTTSPNTNLSGNVTPGAHVTVNGHPAQLHGGFWSASFGLSRGENQVEVQATMAGHTTATESITVTREESSAEHEAKVAAEEQSYKSSATTIPYPELNKDVTRYEGDKVEYEGQVFQIQEEGSEGGWMLVDVTKSEFEIWSNEVYVTFHQRLKATEKSIITFWGEVKGIKSYETKIGGHNEVPEIEAKYVSG